MTLLQASYTEIYSCTRPLCPDLIPCLSDVKTFGAPREPRRAHDSGISEEKAKDQDILQAVTGAQRHPYLLLLDNKPSLVDDRRQAKSV